MGHDISGYNKAGEELLMRGLAWGIIMLSYCTVFLMQMITMQELVDQATVLRTQYNKLKWP